ncbi:ATP-binding protein [Kibdelosporangium persicum]|uniref:Anti-sigma regulatory factor, serine/threonine protein kinase n=1 Tax=Kibdelosporangium persicum TaxID=2698649 RepID=A0ABX2EYM6_9PSEU|nr:ATP-binding protein [Kibdelosporangium persicum]NRN64151.1 Anti-sigma regulatory factor, serine/threonine protein kinase [Kibdelosporangium persicum]
MTKPEQPDPSGDEIEVRIAADAAQLPMLRAITSAVAMRQDYDLDSIADLKMAVDEACSMLVLRAITGSLLTVRFTPKSEIRVVATVLSDSDDWPDTGAFSWHVLSTLTDSLEAGVSQGAADPGGHVLWIELTKRNALGDE